MSHKASPRRTGKMKQQVVSWAYTTMLKAPKKSKGGQKQKVVVHSPPGW